MVTLKPHFKPKFRNMNIHTSLSWSHHGQYSIIILFLSTLSTSRHHTCRYFYHPTLISITPDAVYIQQIAGGCSINTWSSSSNKACHEMLKNSMEIRLVSIKYYMNVRRIEWLGSLTIQSFRISHCCVADRCVSQHVFGLLHQSILSCYTEVDGGGSISSLMML